MDGPVATITLDWPHGRAEDGPLAWNALDGIARSLPGDVRVVVVRGEGPSFGASLDLAAQVTGDPPDEATLASYQAGLTWLTRPDLVSVAAVRGHATGAGFQLALACDLRVLAEDAQLAMAEASRGLVPGLGGTGALVDLVGYPRALEMCLTGRRVGAREAFRLGLAELVVPAAELEAAVADLVAALLAAPRDAAVETKALLLGARGRSRGGRLGAEREAQARRLRDLAGLGE